MQKHRFYAPSISTDSLLDAEESHHLARVLRLREGDRVFAFDGRGLEWECQIARIEKHQTTLTILRQLDHPVDSPLDLTLAAALTKGEKFDWVVQKATELGVTRIVPMITEHCEIKRADERGEQRLQRWRRISLEAVKQCGRRTLVEIDQPVPFQALLERKPDTHHLIFSEKGGRTLKGLAAGLDASRGLCLLVASEGGWSEKELDLAARAGYHAVHLGERILRAETAAIAAVALAQFLFGDLSYEHG